ncbi:flavin reductase like domain-containing protein [Talaromyces proteolyticus]|uniref:Flavin reductase like domain-containing protein n=1 Tax=Talaromyces proteolyticus TaxID=1131652 RepID=A0AAD4KRT6_9EURO|nr:flavin reductase like domain-containing protein [Talaromyces proteolyticus]KAH8697751.1 flavin reductase like domain-containing protein [Talaromyces proteolyticus]
MRLLTRLASTAKWSGSQGGNPIYYRHCNIPSSSHCCPLPLSHSTQRPKRLFSSTHKSNNKSSQQTLPPEPSLSRQVRLLMRRVPHPVAIITTPPSASSTNRTSQSHTTPRGMTVSSFNTVTLNPKPVISFNVHQPSETLLALQSSHRFVVHLLAPTPEAAKLARDFSKGNENLDLGQFEFEADDDNNGTLPRLKRKRRRHTQLQQDKGDDDQDFSFILECKYIPEKTIEIYDHVIVLGTVERLISVSPNISLSQETASGTSRFGVTYADTRFWKMGEEV